MSTPQYKMFLIFVIFKEPKSSVVWQLVFKICYTGYQVLFCLRRIGSVLKQFNIPKYYNQDSLRYFLLSAVLMMIEVSEKK